MEFLQPETAHFSRCGLVDLMVLLFNVTLSIKGILSLPCPVLSESPSLPSFFAICCCVRRPFNPSKVAFTTLWGLFVPMHLVRMFADSRCFHDSTDRPARDNPGSGSGRLQNTLAAPY